MTIQSISANLGVADVAASLDFYTSLLDFKQIATVPDTGPFAWAMLQHGSTTIMFQERTSLSDEYALLKDKPSGGFFTLYVSVTGIDAWYDKLKGKANIIIEPHKTFYGAREFSIQDADGYVLTLSENA
jgi:lactoylglutathione lyase